MVMTILEAHVSKENWATLEQAYRSGIQYGDAGIAQTFLTNQQVAWEFNWNIDG